MGGTDLTVVGGGIQGACVAEAAAAAGLSVLLLERERPAHGTSRRSSKLIHGGLRYLETGQFRLVHECLRERAIWLERAPELVRLVPFIIPVYDRSFRRPWQIAAGLSLYSLLSGFGPGCRFGSVPRSQWAELDGLDDGGLRRVFRYYDGQTDDAALTRAVLGSAARLGARVLYPASFVGARRDGDGWQLAFESGGERQSLHSRALVNAGGPWVNAVLARIDGAHPPQPIDWVQGTHILLEGGLSRGIYYVEAEDRRAVFVMPWHGSTLVGTTEAVYSGNPDQVSPTDGEVEYLRRVFARHFPTRAKARLLDAFAGLRVLPKGADLPFGRPRETLLRVDDPNAPRLVSIYGGKLTAARATAERVLAQLTDGRHGARGVADARRLPLPPLPVHS